MGGGGIRRSSLAVSVAWDGPRSRLSYRGLCAHRRTGHLAAERMASPNTSESIVREDVALKQADDRTVEVGATEASGCRSRTRGAQHESSRTLVHHPPSVYDVRSLALTSPGVQSPANSDTVAAWHPGWPSGRSALPRATNSFHRGGCKSLERSDRDGLCCVATSCPAAASGDVVSHRTPKRDGVVRRWGADRLRRAVDRCEPPGASPRPVPAGLLHRRRHVPGLVRCTHGSGLAGMASDANVVERRSRRGGGRRHGAQRHERGVDGPSVGNLLLVRDPLARRALRHRRRPRAVRVPGDGRLPPAPRR